MPNVTDRRAPSNPRLEVPLEPLSLGFLGVSCRGENHCPGRPIVLTGHRAGHWRLTERKDHDISDILLPKSKDNRWTTSREGSRRKRPISTGASVMHERRRRRAGARDPFDVSARKTDSGFPKAPAPDCAATLLRPSKPVCCGENFRIEDPANIQSCSSSDANRLRCAVSPHSFQMGGGSTEGEVSPRAYAMPGLAGSWMARRLDGWMG